MNAAQIWPWALSAVSLAGFWLAGKKMRIGWLINLGGEALWLTWSVLYHEYGFIASVVPFAAMYAWNWHKWRPAEDGGTGEATTTHPQ